MMGAGNATPAAAASPDARKKQGIPGQFSLLARNVSGPFYSPKEASRELEARYRLRVSEKTLRERCNLRPGHPLRIETNPRFPGRHWIFESELARLAGAEVSA